MNTMRMVDLITAKRDGKEMHKAQIDWLIQGCTSGDIPDYQVSAWLMAVYFSGMSSQEVFWLTEAMASSGEQIDLSGIPGIKVDKHSTGGVGDKTTLIVGPIVAACGAPVAKMSGRGLGHTGGTIDKLEAIPGLQTALSKDAFLRTVREVGFSVVGQSENLAAADKVLYALRDVTGTVESLPLIASSIMSKKIAAGADAILLDVKTGRGAFMDSLDGSLRLGKTMVDIGEALGRKTVALVTDMDEPLGYAIGNTLEVIEALEIMEGRGPVDLQQVCIELAANMLLLAEKAEDLGHCRAMAEAAIRDGSAKSCFFQMVEAQGGDCRFLQDPGKFPLSPITLPVYADRSGFVQAVDALAIGHASVILGAGRMTKDAPIDYSAGLLLKKKIGDRVSAGEVLAELHTDTENRFTEARQEVLTAFPIEEKRPSPPKLIRARISQEACNIFD